MDKLFLIIIGLILAGLLGGVGDGLAALGVPQMDGR